MAPGGGDDENLLDMTSRRKAMSYEEERQREIRRFHERINRGGKPLNIAFIGPAGSGKSSLCNSIMASFSVNCWRERALTGHFGGEGEQVTHHLMSFPKVEYLDFDERYDYNYPTLVDLNGFEDVCDELTEALLRIVFFGRLPAEGKLMDAVKIFKRRGIEGLEEEYSKKDESFKIDRIIFVSSAQTGILPRNLMEAVKRTARRENRVIPIFGVLTHKDLIDPSCAEFKKLESDFKSTLGLPENRYLLCTNYCDTYDKLVGSSRLDQTHAELDVPLLKFMRQVCDDVFRVIQDKVKYKGESEEPSSSTSDIDTRTTTTTSDIDSPTTTTPNDRPILDDGNTKIMLYFVKSVVLAILFWVMMSSNISGRELSDACSQYDFRKYQQGYRLNKLETLCDKIMDTQLWRIGMTLIGIGIFIAFDLWLPSLILKIWNRPAR